jgi:hypothetical protein
MHANSDTIVLTLQKGPTNDNREWSTIITATANNGLSKQYLAKPLHDTGEMAGSLFASQTNIGPHVLLAEKEGTRYGALIEDFLPNSALQTRGALLTNIEQSLVGKDLARVIFTMFDVSAGPSIVHQGAYHEQVRFVGEGKDIRVCFVDWGHTVAVFKESQRARQIILENKISEMFGQFRVFLKDRSHAVLSQFSIELLMLAKQTSKEEYNLYLGVLQNALQNMRKSRFRESKMLGESIRESMASALGS